MKKEEILEKSYKELLKISRKSDDTSDLIDLFVTDKLAMVITRPFIRFGVPANVVSILSFVFSLVGSFFIVPNNLGLNLIGIAMGIFSVIFDNSDGQIARLTGTSSDMGRILDGICDSLGALSMFVALSCRLMNEQIPFLDGKTWGVWIWVLMIVYYSIFYPSQCGMADYYRNVHLYFLNPKRSELTCSEDILNGIRAVNREIPIYVKISQYAYYIWTRLQERRTPKLQQLLSQLKKQGDVPSELAERYIEKSKKYIQLTNVLTYYPRALSMYIMIILGIYAYFFPFAMIVLGVIERYMIVKYEAIAKSMIE